jgi:hypothetical protein
VSRGIAQLIVELLKEFPMLKSTMAKWAVAALLAVPAVPMFGKTIHRHLTVHRTTRAPLVSTYSSHKRTVTHMTTHHASLSASSHHKTLTHKSTSAKNLSHKSTTHRTSLKSGSGQQFKVHVTKMPPTIDGINA